MNFVFKACISILLLSALVTVAYSGNFEELLRERVRANGYLPPNEINILAELELAKIGKQLFESNNLSLTSNISCLTCHRAETGSSDGLPVSVAIGGQGEGLTRLRTGGKLLSRNSLALWGRGGREFNGFFWDGKVSVESGEIISQFGSKIPAQDPLIVALHLPPIEIREMIDETDFIRERKIENVEAAYEVYAAIVDHLRKTEPDISRVLSSYNKISESDLRFRHFAAAIAEFIRDEFPIKQTRLSKFMAENETFSETEIEGGLLFYGKGGCVICHSGPHFSDFKYHTVVFPQLGFGKSGFGVDYGRYSATFRPSDKYKFRTPPLWNVIATAPYGHSGSVVSIENAIKAHFDPLSLVDSENMSSFARHELFKRQTTASEVAQYTGYLSKEEVSKLTTFLKTMSF